MQDITRKRHVYGQPIKCYVTEMCFIGLKCDHATVSHNASPFTKHNTFFFINYIYIVMWSKGTVEWNQDDNI